MPARLCAVLLLIFAPLMAHKLMAHKGATGIVKERMDSMSEMGDATKAVAAMIKGEVELDHIALSAAADTLIEHGEKISGYYPPESQGMHAKVTEALPEIWDDFDRFEVLAIDMTNEARELKAVVDAGSEVKEIGIQFRSVAKSCKACHRDFRKPQ